MFGRNRSRTPVHTVRVPSRPTTPSASSAATTAAASAFLARSTSQNAALSSAAAAAALRSHTTSPTPVGEIQTRRMLKRQSSTASSRSSILGLPDASPASSAARSSPRPGLQRRGSSGSMTERTFRDPSPAGARNRPRASSNQERVPPLPALPQAYSSSRRNSRLSAAPTTAPTTSNDVQSHSTQRPRPQSSGTLQPRPASRPQSSSTLQPASGSRPQSPLAAPVATRPAQQVRLEQGARALSPPAARAKSNSNKEARRDSTTADTPPSPHARRSSVNFSRPISPPPSSPFSNHATPTPAPKKKKRLSSGAESPPSREPRPDDISAADQNFVNHAVRDAATLSTKQKKSRVEPDAVQGSHLEQGGMSTRMHGTVIDGETEPVLAALPTPSEPKTKTKTKKKRLSERSLRDHARTLSDDSDAAGSESSDVASEGRRSGAPKLTKRPSVVHEDPEAEDLGDEAGDRAIRTASISTVSETPGDATEDGSAKTQETAKPRRTRPVKRDEGRLEPPAMRPEASTDDESVSSSKRTSLSPSRQARFASQVSSDLIGGALHQPPARSVSPGKSALKSSPSSRGTSPPADSAQRPSLRNSVTSEAASDTTGTGSVLSGEDGSRPSSSQPTSTAGQNQAAAQSRKKAVRVSFDEAANVVGESAEPPEPSGSPVLASPQNKRPGRTWLGRSSGEVADVDDDGERIQPVPTLPSFGSVRGRKPSPNRSTDSARKVSESEVSDVSTADVPTIKAPTLIGKATAAQGVSSDHALGGIAQEAAVKATEKTKDSAPTQSASRTSDSGKDAAPQPLAPQVTSVEGDGQLDDEDNFSKVAADQPKSTAGIPAIAIQPATPQVPSTERRRSADLGMPGSFEEDRSATPSPEPTSEKDVLPTPSAVGLAEPEAQHDNLPPVGQVSSTMAQQVHPSEPTTGPIGASIEVSPKAAPAIPEETSPEEEDITDDENSVYSDAAEEAGDLDGDGFGSIDAIVESPLVRPVSSPSMEESPLSLDRRLSSTPTTSAPRPSPRMSLPTQSKGQGLDATPNLQKKAAARRSALPAVDTNRTGKPLRTSMRSSASVDTSTTRSVPSPTLSTSSPSSPRRDRPPSSTLRTSMRSAGDAAPPAGKHRRTATEGSAASTAMRATLRNPQRDRPQSESAPRKPEQQASTAPRSTRSSTGPRSPTIPGLVSASTGPRSPTDAGLASPTLSVASPSHSRTMSNDSDSSSSFKRERNRKRKDKANGSGISMRRSMRDVAPAAPTIQQPASPAKSPERRPFSAGSSMRTSLRAPPSRGSSPSKLFGSRKDKGEAKSSRFRNSSDDERPSRPRFSSRFQDSSDEESEALRPVRGIPRPSRIDDDSTDLEDSDDQTATPTTRSKSFLSPKGKSADTKGGSPVNHINGALNPSTVETTVTSDPPAGDRSRRKSLFGILGRRKDRQSVHKTDLDSAARRDTPLERSARQRAALSLLPAATPSPRPASVHEESAVSTPLSTPLDTPSPKFGRPGSRGGKLVRRRTDRSPTSESSPAWPLSPSDPISPVPDPPAGLVDRSDPSTGLVDRSDPSAGLVDRSDPPRGQSTIEPPAQELAAVDVLARPATSDGIEAPRPGLGSRQPSTTLTDVPAGFEASPSSAEHRAKVLAQLQQQDPAEAGAGKKRRFALLRKAFGRKT